MLKGAIFKIPVDYSTKIEVRIKNINDRLIKLEAPDLDDRLYGYLWTKKLTLENKIHKAYHQYSQLKM